MPRPSGVLLAAGLPGAGAPGQCSRNDGRWRRSPLGDLVLIALLQPLLLHARVGMGGCWPPACCAWSLWRIRPYRVAAACCWCRRADRRLVAWIFGRTLLHGRVPLITRMVAGLDGIPARHSRRTCCDYTRNLTPAWAVLLAALALLNLLLAAIAVPNGLLASWASRRR